MRVPGRAGLPNAHAYRPNRARTKPMHMREWRGSGWAVMEWMSRDEVAYSGRECAELRQALRLPFQACDEDDS